MKIGNVELKNNIFLAPMAGITDMPFRRLCVEQGCGLVYTEMVSAKGMFYKDQKSKQLAEIHEEEKPTAVQIFGSDPNILAKIADELNGSDAVLIDINMGCPAPKITKSGEGSALMLRPELIGEIVKQVSKASIKPVTVKIRKGWDDYNINAVEVAKIIEQNGAKAVAVHGRTRDQYYSGKADWDIIGRVKRAISIPVIGNGDIFEPADVRRILQQTGCDAVMIGRGVQGNPWIFQKILTYLEIGTIREDVTPLEKYTMIIKHLDMLSEYKGEYKGTIEMRKHIAWYFKGMRNASIFKERIFKATCREDVKSMLDSSLLEKS